MSSPTTTPLKSGAQAVLCVGALGVVFGDIGTSPLYAMKECLAQLAPGERAEGVLGILSLMTWALLLVVCLKYIGFVMRADNRGEGGIFALLALSHSKTDSTKPNSKIGFTVLVILIGAALLYGDSVITPAISVLSAAEGLKGFSPAFTPYITTIASIILAGLFWFQRKGSKTIGGIFGPVMVVWFLTLGLLGLWQIKDAPQVFAALNPLLGLQLLISHPGGAIIILGSVVLCVTGAEALYADMGHFGRQPIRRAWIMFVLPCLTLNYMGQGALVMAHPEAVANPFFLLGPEWLRLPMVILATLATVIASQALISGAFSVTRQCMQLGFFPRMTVRHTSNTEEGQIYIPQVNMLLAVGVLVLVFAFRSSEHLAAAYGIAVTGTFLCDCVLATVVFRRQFHWPRWAAVGLFGAFFLVDATFFASNALKIPEGGWVPLAMALALLGLMTSWRRGRDLLLARWKQDSMPLQPFLARLPQSRTIRVPGMAVFLTGNPDYVPTALLHNLKHNKVLHERVLFVTVQNTDDPEVPRSARTEVSELGTGIFRVVLRYGFMESPNIPRELEELGDAVRFDPMQASYFLGREVLVPGMEPKLSWWRRWLFLVMARNAVSATEFFRIPSDRVVELGVRVAI